MAIEVGPADATSAENLTQLTIDGELFTVGDEVTLTHLPSGSTVHGTLGTFFGVGRIRGIKVKGPFVSTSFYFGKPEDAETWHLAHRAAERDLANDPVVQRHNANVARSAGYLPPGAF